MGVYVYYDASYKYFGKEHLPYAIMGVLFFLTFVLSPLLLLLLYPTSCFQKCLSSCKLRSHMLHTFVDAFQGHYKDGTEPGTRDCRWLAAIYFLGRIIIFYMFFGALKDIMCFALSGLLFIFLGVVMIIFQPYKLKKLNIYHTLLPFFMAAASLSIMFLDEAEIKARWFIKPAVSLIAIFYTSPILVAMAYFTYCMSYRCHVKCQEVWLCRKNNELGSLSPIKDKKGDESRKHYQAINIE